jgi:hypothetical protein
MDSIKRTLLGFISFSIIVLSSSVTVAENPAHLETTMIRGGFGITAKIKNVGNMTASNITGGCVVRNALTHREKWFLEELPDMAPNQELTLHHIFFFIGHVYVAAGATYYFNGVNDMNYALKNYNALALGPLVIMLESP